MLSVKTRIISVNYGESFYNMLPATLERCKDMEPGGGILRFCQELNSTSVDNLLKILDCLPRELYNQLLCIIVKIYGSEITSKLNYMLQEQEFGRNISIDSIYLGQEPGGEMALYINNIEADYNSLVHYAKDKGLIDKIIQNISSGKLPRSIVSIVLKTVTSMLSGIPSQELEGKLLFLLQQTFIKKKLSDATENFLLSKGVVIKLAGIEFTQSVSIPEETGELGNMEESFLNMLLSCIKPCEF